MRLWKSSNPELNGSLLAGQQARDDAMARAGVLAIVVLRRAIVPAVRAVIGWSFLLFQAIQQESERRRAIAALRELDDRLLKDMGITRGEIMGVVEGVMPCRRGSLAEPSGLRRVGEAAETPAPCRADLPKAA